MNNKLYCSSGAVVSPLNGWDETLLYRCCPHIEADGIELMMVKPYYQKVKELLYAIERSGLSFPILHVEKDIGIYMASEDDEDVKEGLELFRLNCDIASRIGAERAVFHLWSGAVSDTCLHNNLSRLDMLYECAERAGVTLLIENVPCVKNDPITNFRAVAEKRKNAEFVYDMRFGGFHSQNEAFLESPLLCGIGDRGERISHVHVSGYKGPHGDFSSLRPILHLDMGIVDYNALLPVLFSKYGGSVTNESPASDEGGCNVELINRDMEMLKKYSRK